ncbi:MAG TPA: hypothetical protein VN770_01645 [Gaiellaceae bacterium]|nr:hypothetical protein [Gaiellaceae bacterium]
MRRLATIGLSVFALAVPAAALAFTSSSTDGTLVVQGGSAPRGVAVATLVIAGTAIGHVSTGSPDQLDKVVIEDDTLPPGTGEIGASATNGTYLARTSSGDNRTKLVGSDFRFRAAAGTYRIWIYGSGVNVFAVGNGKVTLQGLPDVGSTDGRYSLNGGDWHSLPAAPTDWLAIALPAGVNG